MAKRDPYTGEKLVEGVNADRRGGVLRPRNDPYEDMYGPANKALTDYATQLQGSQAGVESDIRSAGETQKKLVQTAKESTLGTLGSQREKARVGTESAVAQARRVGNELMQGIQSKFGSSTGTGAFAGEILGRQIAGDINTQTNTLEQNLNDIALAEKSIVSEADNKVFQIETETNRSINDARNKLRDTLSQINMKKGELEADKANKRIDALRQFSLFTQQIEAQKEAEKRQLEQQKEMKLFDLQVWKEQQGYAAGLAGRAGGGAGYGSNFQGAADTELKRLATGISDWGSSFNRLKSMFPTATDTQINTALGGSWNPQTGATTGWAMPGAYQNYLGTTSTLKKGEGAIGF